MCGKPAPMPDEEGMLFILRNHDGERLCFPDEEGCEEERDRYPVPGWGHVDGADGEAVLACGDCCDAVRGAVRNASAKRKQRREKL